MKWLKEFKEQLDPVPFIIILMVAAVSVAFVSCHSKMMIAEEEVQPPHKKKSSVDEHGVVCYYSTSNISCVKVTEGPTRQGKLAPSLVSTTQGD